MALRSARRRNATAPAHWLALFAARNLEELIDAAFDVLGTAVSCDFVSAFYRNAGNGLLKERDSLGRESTPAFMRRYAELTPAVRLAMASPGVKLLTTRTGLPQSSRELHASRFYREIMRPQGWRHAVSLCFWGESPAGLPVFVTSVNRREGRRDFARTDLARLARVHPFLDCAVNRILEREAATTVRDGIALAAHDGTHGVAVLDSHFLLVQANPGALELCAGWAVDDTERTPKSDAAPDWRLPSALVAACRGLHEEWQTLIRSDPDTSFRRHRQLVHPSVPGLTARVTMVAPSATSLAGPSFVVELDRRIDAEEPFVPVLQKLTTAERAVAVVVADGLSNQEISERLGKSVEAVKFLLHRIFQKTGVSSRAALVAALRSRPHMRSVTD